MSIIKIQLLYTLKTKSKPQICLFSWTICFVIVSKSNISSTNVMSLGAGLLFEQQMEDGESVLEICLKIIKFAITFCVARGTKIKQSVFNLIKIVEFNLKKGLVKNTDCCIRHVLTNSVQENPLDDDSLIQLCATYFFKHYKPLKTNSSSYIFMRALFYLRVIQCSCSLLLRARKMIHMRM